ncbi:MAG: HipA domain-containing protein, partial [Neoaquamicrobium sediminum]
NFSIFLTPGGQYRLTPIYDVLSAQPSLDANQVPRKKFKMAMFVGTNRHYLVHDIVPRHFRQTADQAGIGATLLDGIFEDLVAHATARMQSVMDGLPPAFPQAMAASIADGLQNRLRQIETYLSGDTHA